MNAKDRHSPRSRADLDRLLDGENDGSALAGFVAEVRDLGSSATTTPNRALTEFVSAPSRGGAATPTSRRKTAMLTTITAALGTTAGKIVLTGTAAAALVTGAAVSDAIDVPGIGPDSTEVIATVDDSTDDSASEASSTSVTSTTIDSGSSPSTSGPTPTSEPARLDVSSTGLADTGSSTIDAVDAVNAGSLTVRVESGDPIVESVDPAPSWSWRYDEEDSDDENEIDVSFRRGEDRVDVEIEIEDGQIRVRVRDRRTDEERFTTLDGAPFPDDDDSNDDDASDDDDDSDDHDDDQEHDDDSDHEDESDVDDR